MRKPVYVIAGIALVFCVWVSAPVLLRKAPDQASVEMRARSIEVTTVSNAVFYTALLLRLPAETNWMGHPMFFESNNFHWADDIELGCRSDGTVVWRRVQLTEEYEKFHHGRIGILDAEGLTR